MGQKYRMAHAKSECPDQPAWFRPRSNWTFKQILIWDFAVRMRHLKLFPYKATIIRLDEVELFIGIQNSTKQSNSLGKYKMESQSY